jgi:5,5'-dehydrodivanillate O-demethylase
VGWVVEDTIRCMYHGWRYDGQGRCVEAPAELPTFASRISINAYPTREYLGLIFAYLGEGHAPEFPRYPEFEAEGVLDVTQYIRMCNYFNNVENNVDPAHTPFTHAVSNYINKGLTGIPDVSGQESDWGIVQYGKRPNGGVRISQHGQPNILNLKFQPTDEESGWKDLITWRIPVDDTYHVAFLVNLVHVTGEKAQRYREWMKEYAATLAQLEPAHEVSQKILRGEMRIKDILDRPDYFEIQDHVSQMSQGVIADRSEEKLGRSDVLVALLRKIWARELRALAEGRPLKQWERTAGIVTTTGLEHLSKNAENASV